MAGKPIWEADESKGFIFADICADDQPAVTDFDDLVDYMDGVIAEGKVNPERALGKLAALMYSFLTVYFNDKADAEIALESFKERYRHHTHEGAVVVKD